MTASPAIREVLLGFDAREAFVDSAEEWSPERRRKYLLRGDVVKPLSADVLVWSNVFGDGLSPGQCARHGALALPDGTWRGPNAPLWEDLDRLLAAIAPLANASRVVAVGWITEAPVGQQRAAPPYLEPTRPATLGPEWELLGFDVTDGSISGLSNCGYGDEERSDLAARFGPRLNEHHLFARAEDAIEFAALTDERVPEHAPFLAFALRAWRVG